jgi:hypothetical protein
METGLTNHIGVRGPRSRPTFHDFEANSVESILQHRNAVTPHWACHLVR